ncbi:MAG TPA: lycopene beta-cyclase CrtY [Kofleriaceae bacterium]|jgi:lycopene beta-cyclase
MPDVEDSLTSDVYDYALVGGGLANGLIALAVRAHQPDARIAMVERGDAPGGNHTWCFHARDVSSTMGWIEPLVEHRWPGYDVMFPEHSRRLDTPYACVSATRLSACVSNALAVPGSALFTKTTATEIADERVTLDNGNVIQARAVIDARGPDRYAETLAVETGWQKFVGQEVTLRKPHGLERPILMDATVPQVDGYRFFYVLPLSENRLLVEDTYFSDSSDLDAAHVRTEIDAYCHSQGWLVASIDREEAGVLPMPLSTAAPTPGSPFIAGYAGRWFHPVTAYSFPIAARVAELVASRPADELVGPALQQLARAHGKQLAFGDRLNKMLFRWFAPEKRHHVLARFYRLPPATIERFYALQLTGMDRARIFVGRPPKGLSIRAMFGGSP